VRVATLRQALWHRHVNAVNAPVAMRSWLTTGGSLTARLSAHSSAFRVQRLHQRTALCLFDEARAIGMRRPGRVWEREVLLRCDGAPVVFAHTVVPMSATAADWPLFNALGERSLGSTLFYDPRVARGDLEFARIRAGHPLMQRARAALGAADDTIFFARRCLYRRRRGTLLVTEVFLPAVLELASRIHHNIK
jgi:chorismate--pyruvate lyase